jgi:hypothetical protein
MRPNRFVPLVLLLGVSFQLWAAAAEPDIFQSIRKGDATAVAVASSASALVRGEGSLRPYPLTNAIFLRQEEIAKFLVAKGSPLTPFDAAALGETSSLRNMIAANPSLLKLRYFGRTLLMWAALRHHPETVDESGATLCKTMPYSKRQRPDATVNARKFNVKLWDDEKAFLREAADRTRHKNLSYYIMDAALSKAEIDLGRKFKEDPKLRLRPR